MRATTRLFPLPLQVLTPCDVPAEQLVATKEGASCTSCEKVVHDLSLLTFDEAEALFRWARERGVGLCSEMSVRKRDGAVLLADGYVLPQNQSGKRRLPMTNALAAAGAVILAACADAPPVVPELPTPQIQASPQPAPRAPQPAAPSAPQAAMPVAASDEPMEDPQAAPVPPPLLTKAVAPAHKAPPKGKKPGIVTIRGDMAY